MKTKIVLLCILVITPLLSLGMFSETVEGAYTSSYSVLGGYNQVCKPWIAAGYGCHPTYWDHNARRPCRSGMINCDDHATCTSYGGPSVCYDSVPWYYTAYTCHYTTVSSWSACVGGLQNATSQSWQSVGGTSCSDQATTRACCNPPTGSLTLNGGVNTTVNQGTNFTVDWSFSNPGQTYSCTLERPTMSSFATGAVGQTGNQNDVVADTKSPVASVAYQYRLDCIGSGVCAPLPLTRTANLYVVPVNYTVTTSASTCARTGDVLRNGSALITITAPSIPVSQYGFQCDAQPWVWKVGNSHTCSFLGAGPHTVWTSLKNMSGTTVVTNSTVVNVAECPCGIPVVDFTIEAQKGTVTVNQGSNFNVDWSFYDSGELYTCLLAAPIESAPGAGSVGVSLVGSRTDVITTLRDPSDSTTDYEYRLNCTNPAGVCAPTSDLINVQVDDLDFSINVEPDAESKNIGDTVNWLVTPYGGYPPITYEWTGGIVSPWGVTTSFAKQYGFEGIVTVTVNARDNTGQTTVDNGSVNIVDSRIQQ